MVAKELVKAVRTGISARRSLALPVIAGKDLLALIYLELPGPAGADERQSGWQRMTYMGTAFCEEISLAFANLRLRSELSQQAIRDPLTGLFNRRYMEEALARELKRAERHHTALSVLMIDLDHFKLLNDQFGHACGDAVLKGMGGTILWHSRDDDIACRYGGEEILVVLPNTPLEGAVAKANQIRSHIKKLASLTKYRRQITASIGIASYPQDGLTVGALVKSADAAMYTAKRLGRNSRVPRERIGADECVEIGRSRRTLLQSQHESTLRRRHRNYQHGLHTAGSRTWNRSDAGGSRATQNQSSSFCKDSPIRHSRSCRGQPRTARLGF
jgi:diguanylate cyclase (GGDEF)-like protein